MGYGLATTFRILAATPNKAAVDVLVHALDSPHREIQEEAFRAILERKSLRGQREILRRLHRFDATWNAKIDHHGGWMSQVLRDAVLGSDLRMCVNGCQAALRHREYELVPTLLTALEDDSNPYHELAAVTLLSFIDLLSDELAGPREHRRRRDPQLVRRNVTANLEHSVLRYAKHQRDEVLEAFLALADRENMVLHTIVQDVFHPAYATMGRILLKSPRPGVIRLILSFMDDPNAPLAVLNAMAKRTDKRFVQAFLRCAAPEWNASAAQNLKRLETIAWAKPHSPLFDELDDDSQQASIKVVLASGMKRRDSLAVVEHLLLRGTVGGRRAAADSLAQFTGNDVNGLVRRALEDRDPMVHAAGLGHMRQKGIPGALSRLIEALDHPHEAVRKTARENLQEFSFARFLSAFDTLDEQMRTNTGNLVRKVDLRSLDLLREELRTPSRTRRLRALEVAVALDYSREIESIAIKLLGDDEDYMVRVRSARVLSHCRSTAAQQALSDAQGLDRSGVVRDAAGESLQLIADTAAMEPYSPSSSTYSSKETHLGPSKETHPGGDAKPGEVTPPLDLGYSGTGGDVHA